MPMYSQRQKGSSLVIAIFLIVVFMLLGTTMVRILSTGEETIAYEVVGTRALSAANSALQADLQKLFPSTGTALDCPPGSNTSTYTFALVEGLDNCNAKVTCTNYATDDEEVEYYRLQSTGTCGIANRTVQVEARSM